MGRFVKIKYQLSKIFILTVDSSGNLFTRKRILPLLVLIHEFSVNLNVINKGNLTKFQHCTYNSSLIYSSLIKAL